MNDIRNALTQSLLGHEGEVLRAYDDATGKVVDKGTTVQGYVTVGVGRNLVGRGITQVESRYLLGNDIDAVERELDERFPVWRSFSAGRRLALMELCFNMGTVRFLGGWPNAVSDMIAGRWQDVAKRLAASLWRKQVGETRAQHIIRLILSGEI